MLRRLASRLATTAVQLQQQQHQHTQQVTTTALLPLLRQLQFQQQQQQHAAVQQAGAGGVSWLQQQHHPQQPWPCYAASRHHQLQLAHAYSQRTSKLNPKERKAQTVKDKKALKKSAVPQSTASASDSATSFEDDMQAVEADVTRLVLQAIHNITPVLDVRTVRSATTVKYVPGLMPARKARSLALHWLVKAADTRKKNSSASYAECLALELLLAYQKRGGARQKRDDLHKLALQNRANLHMRWW